jgi:hypothetical protein
MEVEATQEAEPSEILGQAKRKRHEKDDDGPDEKRATVELVHRFKGEEETA